MQTRTTAPPTPRTSWRVRPIRPMPREASSARSLAAVVARSSMIAMATISRPGTIAPPTSLRTSARRTGLPRPGPSTYDAMIAIDSAAIVVWLSPTMMVLRAIGSCTLVSRCHQVWPTESVASIVVVGDGPDAVAADPDEGRQRVDQRADDRAGDADAEEQHDRQQVDEGGHGLHQVQERRDDGLGPLLRADEHGEGQPDETTKNTDIPVTSSRSIESDQKPRRPKETKTAPISSAMRQVAAASPIQTARAVTPSQPIGGPAAGSPAPRRCPAARRRRCGRSRRCWW